MATVSEAWAQAPSRVERVPRPDDGSRWVRVQVSGRAYRFAQPITFTPYAAARACSARCQFCSETLVPVRSGPVAARMRPGPGYFDALAHALDQLRGVPLHWSLSGLETTDDGPWMRAMLDTLCEAERRGTHVGDRVLYTNGAGLAATGGEALVAALETFGLSWLELSRHHFDPVRNQALMRFRDGVAVREGRVFETLAHALAPRLPFKLVCIVQAGGIQDAAGVQAYLEWARGLGARWVIFRELSVLDAAYRDNVTARYIQSHRVAVDALVDECRHAPFWGGLRHVEDTDGYYFRNRVLEAADAMRVTFEVADYGQMHARHDSGDIYKLVFHANGNLCSGWEPERDVLLRPSDA